MDAHPAAPIKLLLADVDGTLVTPDKELTDRAIDAVHKLRKAGIRFAVTSGRPPRGMSMLIEPLKLDTPISAFNGGLIVDPQLHTLEQRVIAPHLVMPIVQTLDSHHLDAWLYRGNDWDVRDAKAPHVDREAETVRFAPNVVDSFEGLTGDVAKLVGVSDDRDKIDAATSAVHEQFGDHVSAAQSQPYYLDVTHPDANKGAVVAYLSAHYSIPPTQIATIGDGANDTLMFAKSGLSIAMGNASEEVKQAATKTTASNEDEGFAEAVQRFVLPTAG